jgi:hypothetical protein
MTHGAEDTCGAGADDVVAVTVAAARSNAWRQARSGGHSGNRERACLVKSISDDTDAASAIVSRCMALLRLVAAVGRTEEGASWLALSQLKSKVKAARVAIPNMTSTRKVKKKKKKNGNEGTNASHASRDVGFFFRQRSITPRALSGLDCAR